MWGGLNGSSLASKNECGFAPMRHLMYSKNANRTTDHVVLRLSEPSPLPSFTFDAAKVIVSHPCASTFLSRASHRLILTQALLRNVSCSFVRLSIGVLSSINHIPQQLRNPIADPLLNNTQNPLIASRNLGLARRRAVHSLDGTCLARWWDRGKIRHLGIVRDKVQIV